MRQRPGFPGEIVRAVVGWVVDIRYLWIMLRRTKEGMGGEGSEVGSDGDAFEIDIG